METALHILRGAADAGAAGHYDWLVLSPRLEPLRSDPRFDEILARSRSQFEKLLAVMETAQAEGHFPEYLEQPLADLQAQLAAAGA